MQIVHSELSRHEVSERDQFIDRELVQMVQISCIMFGNIMPHKMSLVFVALDGIIWIDSDVIGRVDGYIVPGFIVGGGRLLISLQNRHRQIQQTRHIVTPQATVKYRTMDRTVNGSQSSEASSQLANARIDIFSTPRFEQLEKLVC